ncbi:hypothetical protein B0H15DRAFT_1018340 [Mycena belliarum]|uniref:Uncharacterized protein n=1 Tax=Mycena belliarum TaxID=1033014 RepID=A0AAD6UDJ5_9AGAR|nr:hypothetical protein B0H15DRAFT_1018340 [Mycena belliae]
MSERYHLNLEESTLIFFPPHGRGTRGLQEPYVVQVMIKPETRFKSPTRDEVASFYDAQEDITAAVEAILLKNLIEPLHNTTIVADGDGYVLTGVKKEWVYGQGLELKWGDEVVRTCKDKWVFYFRTGTGSEHVKDS